MVGILRNLESIFDKDTFVCFSWTTLYVVNLGRLRVSLVCKFTRLNPRSEQLRFLLGTCLLPYAHPHVLSSLNITTVLGSIH